MLSNVHAIRNREVSIVPNIMKRRYLWGSLRGPDFHQALLRDLSVERSAFIEWMVYVLR